MLLCVLSSVCWCCECKWDFTCLFVAWIYKFDRFVSEHWCEWDHKFCFFFPGARRLGVGMLPEICPMWFMVLPPVLCYFQEFCVLRVLFFLFNPLIFISVFLLKNFFDALTEGWHWGLCSLGRIPSFGVTPHAAHCLPVLNALFTLFRVLWGNKKLNWIETRAKAARNTDAVCQLCLKEATEIVFADKNCINKRNEVMNTCRHKRKFLLKHLKPEPDWMLLCVCLFFDYLVHFFAFMCFCCGRDGGETYRV